MRLRRGSRRRWRRRRRSASGRIHAAVAERAAQVIDLADEFAIPVVSSRDETERAGVCCADDVIGVS